MLYKYIYNPDEDDVKIESSLKYHLKYKDILEGFEFIKISKKGH